jgi:dihydroorotate dehydrogenase electron transfer subunit
VLPRYAKSKVTENIEISKNIYSLTIEGSFDIMPGQFFMVRSWETEPLFSRPISVHDASDSSVTFLYEVRGRGTANLSILKSGDCLNVLGPLGKGFDVRCIKGRVAVVTGGIGAAPMLYTVKSLKCDAVDLYSGFRDEIYSLEEFRSYTESIHIATDSGKHGHKGLVTEIFNPGGYSMVLCCGPEIMMKKVVEQCVNSGTPVLISMEKRMACGLGACLGCTCGTREGNRRTCKDGPVFDGRDVIFDA